MLACFYFVIHFSIIWVHILRIPVIGGKELDLHILYVEVTRRGGFEKVRLFNYSLLFK